MGLAFCRGLERIHRSSIAVLGWSYLLLLHVAALYDHVGHHLLAPTLLRYLADRIHADAAPFGFQSVPIGLFRASGTCGGLGGGVTLHVEFADCVRTGVAIAALLRALLGGYAACHFATPRSTEAAPPLAETTSVV